MELDPAHIRQALLLSYRAWDCFKIALCGKRDGSVVKSSSFFFQRTWVWFPASTWLVQLTIVWNSSSWGTHTLFWLLLAPHECDTQTYMQAKSTTFSSVGEEQHMVTTEPLLQTLPLIVFWMYVCMRAFPTCSLANFTCVSCLVKCLYKSFAYKSIFVIKMDSVFTYILAVLWY